MRPIRRMVSIESEVGRKRDQRIDDNIYHRVEDLRV